MKESVDYVRRRQHQLRRKKLHRRRQIVNRVVKVLLIAAVFGIGFFAYFQLQNKRSKDTLPEVTEPTVDVAGLVKETSTQEAMPIDELETSTEEITSEEQGIEKELQDFVDEYPEADVILEEIEDYPEDVLYMLVNYPETLEFVLGYKDNVGVETPVDISEDLEKPGIPLFLQWDKRWGYQTYADNILAINGCGPTCMAMIAAGLTGNTILNPKYVADMAYKNGYYSGESGTAWGLMREGSQMLGLNYTEVGGDAISIKNQLKLGRVMIASMGPGDFTKVGHYIVITGLNDDGTLNVNDPNSKERSAKTWDPEVIASQVKNIWAYWN